jgi:hypothetical protein
VRTLLVSCASQYCSWDGRLGLLAAASSTSSSAVYATAMCQMEAMRA